MQLLLPNTEKNGSNCSYSILQKIIFLRFFFPIFSFHKLKRQSDFFYGCDNDKCEFNRLYILAKKFSRKYRVSNRASNGIWSQQQSHKETKNWFRSSWAKKFFLFFSKKESPNILVGPILFHWTWPIALLCGNISCILLKMGKKSLTFSSEKLQRI